jgi:hypothetical protein
MACRNLLSDRYTYLLFKDGFYFIQLASLILAFNFKQTVAGSVAFTDAAILEYLTIALPPLAVLASVACNGVTHCFLV